MQNKHKTIKYTIFLGSLILALFVLAKPASAFYIFPEKTANLTKDNEIIANISIPEATPQITKINEPKIITQVKVKGSNTVYYLDRARNIKKAYVNEQAYFAYKNTWDEIEIVDQNELNKWIDLRIVTSKNTQDIYYLGNNKKAKIDPIYFDILSIDPEKIINIHPVDLASYQIANYADVGLTIPEQNNVIFIELSPESPKAGFLANNTKDNLLSVFTLSSPLDTAEITSITFNLGIFNSSVIERLYLTDEGGTELKIPSSYNNQKVTFNFRDSLIIRKNQPKKLKLFVNLGSCQSCSNDAIQATIGSANDIKATINFVDNFPIKAAVFKLVDTDSTLASITIEEKNTNISSNIVIGATDQILAKFQINETSGNEDIVLKQASFIARGTLSRDDLANFKIKIDGKIITQTNAMIRGNEIIFNIPSYVINKNESKELMITGNVISGENKTVNIDFESAQILGKQTGFSLGANSSESINSALSITKETLSIFSLDLKNNQKVFSYQKGVIIGSFQIRNMNQKINLESVDIKMAKNTAAPNLEDLVYLVDYKTGQVLGSANGAKFAQGEINMSLNNYKLLPRQEVTISLITNIPRYAKDGDNYQISLDKIY